MLLCYKDSFLYFVSLEELGLLFTFEGVLHVTEVLQIAPLHVFSSNVLFEEFFRRSLRLSTNLSLLSVGGTL